MAFNLLRTFLESTSVTVAAHMFYDIGQVTLIHIQYTNDISFFEEQNGLSFR